MEHKIPLQHKDVMIRATVNKPPQDVEKTKEWMLSTINKLGMTPLYGPVAIYHDQIGNRGITGFCIITTSDVKIHVWDEVSPALIEYDIYTCGAMDLNVVFEAFQEFDPVRLEYKYHDREHGLEELEHIVFEY